MFEINDKLRAMNRLRKEADNVQEKMRLQLDFEKRWKIAPHDFDSYTLIPKGRSELGYITYHTEIKLKDGSRVSLPTNVRKDLHPHTWEDKK